MIKDPSVYNTDRFWNKVSKTESCWNWTGCLTRKMYGIFSVENNRVVSVHRLSYMMRYGVITPDVHICHSCDNRQCVNPDHLFTGTNKDNITDKVIKGRAKPGGWRLSEYTVSNVKRLYKSGYRQREICCILYLAPGVVAGICNNRTYKGYSNECN